MTEISANPYSIVHKIYEYYEQKANEEDRQHLGASVIGKECWRALWYSFRWANENKFSGKTLRLFETGHLAEARIANSMLEIGLQVHLFDRFGKQFSFKEYGGHFSGSMDGCVLGVLAAPKTWHVLEFKTHNKKSFAALLSKGVKESKYEHYCQVQIYMHYTGMTRALYIAENKDTSELYEERINYDAGEALQLIAKAKNIIFSPTPLKKIAESSSSYKCKYCPSANLCHDGGKPRMNCRTCLHSTPRESGGWFCEKRGMSLSFEDQKKGCEKHLWIPDLISMQQVDATETSVEYKDINGKTWVNREGGKLDAA